MDIFPVEVDGKCFSINNSGKRVSKIYDQFYPNYQGEVVMVGDAGICIFDWNGYTREIKGHPPVRQIQNAHFLKGGIIAYTTSDGVQFYSNDKPISEAQNYIPPSNDGHDILIQTRDGWGLHNKTLSLMRRLPDKTYVDLSADGWALYRKGRLFGYVNVNDLTDIDAKYVSASPVKNGFCIVADDQKAFYAATLNAGSVKLVGGPFSGGGTWISSDGMYAVVRNSNSGMIGVIDREGRNVVAPEYTLWSIVSPSIIFLAKDGDRTWHQFSGKLQKTNVDVGMAVYDLGFKEVYLFETFSHVGYVNSDWKVIVRVKKAKEYHPPVIR